MKYLGLILLGLLLGFALGKMMLVSNDERLAGATQLPPAAVPPVPDRPPIMNEIEEEPLKPEPEQNTELELDPESEPEKEEEPVMDNNIPEPSPVCSNPIQLDEPDKIIALTFDDGPDKKYTPQVLDLLKECEVKATFFVVGTQLRKYPEILERIHEEGHDIGNHSWSHADFKKLSINQMKQEMRKVNDLIEEIIGEETRLFRAPYGSVSNTVTKTVEEAGFELIHWTVDTRDWAGTSVDNIMENVQSQSESGGIILMHSFGGKNGDLNNMLAALPEIINYLREQGYHFVTVSELLESGQ